MTRRRFDPSLMAGPAGPGGNPGQPAGPATPGGAGGDAPWSVRELCEKIDGALRSGLPTRVRVAGEISQFQERTHWYFALKDEGGVISCVMFAGAAKRAAWRPEVGLRGVCEGRVEYYAPGGRVSLIVDRVEPAGEGARELALRKLVEEARRLGWLDAARKRPLPMMPRKVAVVTSATGAALQDVLTTMRKRCPGVGVVVVDVRVQGERAPAEVARAIRVVSERAGAMGVDAVLVTRGGGSAEDLWAFNDRAIAEAIVACAVPVVAAIGHETDTTLAELVADERCATPTQAAVRLTPDTAALAREVDSLRARLWHGVTRQARLRREALDGITRRVRFAQSARLARAGQRVGRLAERLGRRHPAAVHAGTVAKFQGVWRALHAAAREAVSARGTGELEARLARGVGARLALARGNLDALGRQLRAVGPLGVLARGYSVTFRADGRAVRRAEDVAPGETLETRVHEGVVWSQVQRRGGAWHPGPPPTPPTPPTPARRRGRADEAGPTLFGDAPGGG